MLGQDLSVQIQKASFNDGSGGVTVDFVECVVLSHIRRDGLVIIFKAGFTSISVDEASCQTGGIFGVGG